MLYRVVDTYDLHNTVELQPGESYPARCLVEDPSGIRIMIVPDDSPIEAVHWEYAHGDGAQAILRAQPMSFVLTETFVEHREAQGVWHVFHLLEEYWTRCEKPLSYLEMADYVSTTPAGEETGFCHLHTHSEHSALDGLSTVREMVQAAVADGQRALAITDHGVCAAHPALQLACQQAGIKPIFGLEAYFVDNRHDRGDEHRNDYMHLVLLAMTEQGLLNLWALSTESYRTGQYYKPRIDWELLEKLGDGIIATTGCLRGPLLHPYLEGDEEKALQNLSRLKSIFGDRLYIELHVNQLPQQIEGNKWLVEVSEKYGVPLVAVVDSHYTHERERELHRTWLSIQTNSDVQDDSSLFAGGQDYHLMTRVEVASALHRGQGLPPEVVDEAILNTGRVADRCTAEMTGKDHNPIYSKPTEEWPDPVAHDVDRLWDLCFERWEERTVGKANSQDEYMARLEREMTLLIDKRFCGYFLMEWDIVMYAKRNGVLVGPGRGSGGGSLVAYLIGITEIDPVEADLLFERFLTDGRTELPDFDCVAGTTAFHRDGPGDRTVAALYALLHGRPDAPAGECEVCGQAMESMKRGYMGNPSAWLCNMCYKKRHHLRSKGLPSILGRNILGRLSNQPLVDVLYKGIRDTVRITVSDGRCIESTPEHRHMTISGWKEARNILPGDLMVLMDDRGRRASHTDNLGAGTKALLVKRAGGACERCFKKAPENESWLGKFEVAQLDYSTKNIDNMLFLCVGCHRRMDAQLGTPVVFRPVISAEDAGKQAVYDMVMGHEDHSWVGNGFITHNCDFPSSKKKFMLDYVASRWGEDHVCTVGTHLRLKNKAVINDTSRAMKSLLAEDAFRDMRAVSAIIDEAEASTAGLGLSWDELWVQAGEVLEPYRQKYPEVFEIAAQLHGRLKTYGKHAAGVIIDPENPLTGALPLRRGEDEEGMISQFDMHALVSLGFVKFDMLNIRNLDTIQDTVDLIRAQTGREITPYTWRDEYRDPQIWDEISDGWTLGMFQIETVSGTRLTRRFRPTSLAELSDVITLVRPGPMRSGLTEIYFRRRNGDEEVSYADARLEAILSRTYGTMLYQEDIMAVAMSLAGYDSNEADAVRKILGKKKVELVNEAGEKFVRRSVANGTDREVAEHLWEQMAEFAKYSFGRAHAYAYAMLGFWTGWLKFHYPIQFLTAALSTVKQERVPEFVEEARRMGYNILPPDINESGEGFTSSPGRMAVRYGLKAVKGIGDAAVAAIIENRPYTSWEDFQERKGPKCNSGHIKTLVHIGAMDSLYPNRRALEKLMEVEAIPGSDRCSWKDPATVSEWNGLPCTFDWASEPPPLGRTGKPTKPKPVPKKCTRACRQFAPTPLPDPAIIAPYTDADIRTIEMDTLGVYLSSTPFDRIPEEDRKEFATAADIMVGAHGTYMLAVVLKTVRQKPGGDRNGNAMGWLTLTTERGEIDCVVFHSTWAKHEKHFKAGTMAYVALNKNDRGQTLELFEPLDI